jgi:DHA2 family multidrug resistance protein
MSRRTGLGTENRAIDSHEFDPALSPARPGLFAMTTVEAVSRSAIRPNQMMITLIAMSATVMQVLDTTIANVALPHMQGSLGATQDQIAWVLTSYIVVSAIATPLTGWTAASLGRTRAFILAVLAFTVTSILCGVATTLPQIVLFRIMQGAAGAILTPLSQSILLDAYPRHETARAMGIFSIGVMVGPILGPIVGGWLTEEYSWRWCFYINVPIGVAVILGALIFVPETSRATGRKLDWFGFAFLSIAIGAFQLVLDRGEQKGWFQSPEILVESALAIFGLYMFIVHSMTTKNPFIDVRLFADRTYVIGVSIMAMIFMVYLGALVLVPQLLQLEMNYPVFTAGLATSPRGVGMVVMFILIGRLGKNINPRWLIGTGMVLNGISLYLMSRWSPTIGMEQIVWTGVLQGFGMGLISLPVATVAFSTLTEELRTDGSAFFSLMRNLGGAIGVAVVSSRIVELTQIHHGYLSEFMTPFRHLPLGMSGMSEGAAMKVMNFNITHQAGMIAYINGFLLLAILSIAMLPLVFFLRTPRIAPKPGSIAAVAD